ncbi:MAG: hypothetical protein Q9167_002181 [Letrouitia subvulpina]
MASPSESRTITLDHWPRLAPCSDIVSTASKAPCVPETPPLVQRKPQGNWDRHTVKIIHKGVPIRLEGLDHGWFSHVDFYNPTVRHYPPYLNHESSDGSKFGFLADVPLIEHIDSSVMWKRLKFDDGAKLLEIHRAFKTSLEEVLLSQFLRFQRKMLADQLAQSSDRRKDATFSGRFHFHRCDLIISMIKSLDMKGPAMKLLLLYLFAQEFLAESSCGNSEFGAVVVCFQYGPTTDAYFQSQKHIEVAWVPDFLSFEGLQAPVKEGQQIVVQPRYRRYSTQGFGHPLVSVTYRLISYHPWLNWNEALAAYVGIVPTLCENQSSEGGIGKKQSTQCESSHPVMNLIRVEIGASITAAYPSFEVQVERNIRARLNLKVFSRKCWAESLTREIYKVNARDHPTIFQNSQPLKLPEYEFLRSKFSEFGLSTREIQRIRHFKTFVNGSNEVDTCEPGEERDTRRLSDAIVLSKIESNSPRDRSPGISADQKIFPDAIPSTTAKTTAFLHDILPRTSFAQSDQNLNKDEQSFTVPNSIAVQSVTPKSDNGTLARQQGNKNVQSEQKPEYEDHNDLGGMQLPKGSPVSGSSKEAASFWDSPTRLHESATYRSTGGGERELSNNDLFLESGKEDGPETECEIQD